VFIPPQPPCFSSGNLPLTQKGLLGTPRRVYLSYKFFFLDVRSTTLGSVAFLISGPELPVAEFPGQESPEVKFLNMSQGADHQHPVWLCLLIACGPVAPSRCLAFPLRGETFFSFFSRTIHSPTHERPPFLLWWVVGDCRSLPHLFL